jgi:GT2 family glycosyltransferase
MARRCDIGAIAIGRNEGDRLRRCLQSLSGAAKVIYVDSGSTDGSAEWARKQGIEVIELDASSPFTAARARNSGYRRARELAPEISYVQFVDGDCELDEGWLTISQSFLDMHPDVAMVCGRLRERHPEDSIYNWLCDREWDTPSGEVRACGGIALMRTSAFAASGGYRDDLIAGEEPELCVRLRAAGWRIWRLDCEMATHDAAMKHFSQWWRRTVRNGYAFAQGAYMHGKSREHHWLWEARRAWLWGVWLPLGCLAVGLAFEPWGWIAFLVYPLQVLRQVVRNQGPLGQRALLALFQVLSRFPEAWGQIKFMRDRLLGRQAHLTEYK